MRQAKVVAHIKAVAVPWKWTVRLLHFEDNVMMRQKGASFRCAFLIGPPLQYLSRCPEYYNFIKQSKTAHLYVTGALIA